MSNFQYSSKLKRFDRLHAVIFDQFSLRKQQQTNKTRTNI